MRIDRNVHVQVLLINVVVCIVKIDCDKEELCWFLFPKALKVANKQIGPDVS